MTRRSLAAVAGALILTAATPAAAPALTPEDETSIRGNIAAYREAWMNGSAEGVMATLTDDATLLPSGMEPIVGNEAIRAFWWPPEAAPFTITVMDLRVDRIEAVGGLAWAYGRGSLSFTYVEGGETKSVTSNSTFLNILRRQEDGSWKTAVRMWSDRRPPR